MAFTITIEAFVGNCPMKRYFFFILYFSALVSVQLYTCHLPDLTHLCFYFPPGFYSDHPLECDQNDSMGECLILHLIICGLGYKNAPFFFIDLVSIRLQLSDVEHEIQKNQKPLSRFLPQVRVWVTCSYGKKNIRE